jgi:replicative DNA helicase
MSDVIDRLPPHSPEAEQGALGCVLLDGQLADELRLDWFFDLRHRSLAEVIQDMAREGNPVTLESVGQRLLELKQDNTVGGLAYMADLPGKTTPSMLAHWRDILEDKLALRRAVATASKAIQSAYQPGASADTVLDNYEKNVLEIRQTGSPGDMTIQELMGECLTYLEEAQANPGKLRGLATGFPDFDELTNGLQPQQLVVIAARPSVGKTALALNIADHVVINQGLPVGVLSLEMSAGQLALRLACSRASVDSMSAMKGNLTKADIHKLTAAITTIRRAPLHICDEGGLTIGQVRAKARRMVQRDAVKLLVVDYLQLLRSGDRYLDNRVTEITLVSNGLKALAKELNVPVIALAQLNREVERDQRQPRLSDLRDSGSIEQDADVVALLHRHGSVDGDQQPVDLIIAKQRNGPLGKVELTFLRNFTRFESGSR